MQCKALFLKSHTFKIGIKTQFKKMGKKGEKEKI